MPDAIRAELFDAAVLSGPKTAIKHLQRAVEEMQDGVIGPKTLQALQSVPSPRLVARFNALRLYHLASLPHWSTFGKGWARRIAANLLEA